MHQRRLIAPEAIRIAAPYGQYTPTNRLEISFHVVPNKTGCSCNDYRFHGVKTI
jgi:hypothetical protein